MASIVIIEKTVRDTRIWILNVHVNVSIQDIFYGVLIVRGVPRIGGTVVVLVGLGRILAV